MSFNKRRGQTVQFWRSSDVPENIETIQAQVVLTPELSDCTFSSDDHGNIVAVRIDGMDKLCLIPWVVDILVSLKSLKTIECSALYGSGKLCNRWLQRLLESTFSGRLFLWGHSGITDDALIVSDSNISELLINGSPLTNQIFHYLCRFRSLHLLQLIDTQIVTVSSNELNMIPNLRQVALNNYAVGSIDPSLLRHSIEIIQYNTN
jgi:hypothetical protein